METLLGPRAGVGVSNTDRDAGPGGDIGSAVLSWSRVDVRPLSGT